VASCPRPTERIPVAPWSPGRTPALRRAPRRITRGAEQEGIYDVTFPASIPPNSVATLRPLFEQSPKAGNILKTKGRNRAFCAAKAGNILKQSNLQKSARTRKTHDKVPDTKYAKGWAQGAPQSYESGKEPIYLSHSGSLWAVVFSSPKGAPYSSPGQRPGFPGSGYTPSPEGARYDL